MAKWDYLFLNIVGHNKPPYEADNMLVTTSDGRWRREKVPKNVFVVVGQLGEEGWEIVNCSGGGGGGGARRDMWPGYSFDAVFKRPRRLGHLRAGADRG